jgi:carbon monoxide dehydrogenase subunit G
MKISGTYTIAAPRAKVWQALMDPATIQRITPGCEKLEQVAPNHFKTALRAGVGAIKGLFNGEITLSDIDPENAYTLNSRIKAPVGFVDGNSRIELKDGASPDTTTVTFDGDAKIGGPLAAVAGRLIQAAAQKNIEEMFTRLTNELVVHH